jgi:hypothetical protein
MTRSIRLAAVCALALTAALAVGPGAAGAAAKVRANLRVLTTGGGILAEEALRTGTTRLPTSPKADCLGTGTGGSGKPAVVPGATALGLLGDAAKHNAALRPLLLTDHFSFGLGICGIGGHAASGEASWYLKVNHRNPNKGGDSVKLKPGDDVLWYLSPTFPYPDELVLSGPRKAAAGRPFGVRVFAYDDKGKRTPAAGAKVTGAARPTGADGRTEVTLRRPALLVARDGEDIPSNRVAVCLGRRCPRSPR